MGMINNVTKRASGAIHDLELAMDKLRDLDYIRDDKNVSLWFETLDLIGSAQRNMCYMLIQDLKVKDEDEG